jgi:hypothetical protein
MGLSLIILWKTNLARARATHLESPFFLTQLRISPAAASIASHRPPPASHLAGRRQHLISPAAASIASRRPPPASHLAGRHHHHRSSLTAGSVQAPSTRSMPPQTPPSRASVRAAAKP